MYTLVPNATQTAMGMDYVQMVWNVIVLIILKERTVTQHNTIPFSFQKALITLVILETVTVKQTVRLIRNR